MWDSGLMDEKLGPELSLDEETYIPALSSDVNNTLHKLQHDRKKKPGITCRPPPFHSSQSELSNIQHQIHPS